MFSLSGVKEFTVVNAMRNHRFHAIFQLSVLKQFIIDKQCKIVCFQSVNLLPIYNVGKAEAEAVPSPIYTLSRYLVIIKTLKQK